MATQERTIWGIHGGKTGDADSLFLKKKYIAVGWSKCGDSVPCRLTVRRSKPKWRNAFQTRSLGRFRTMQGNCIALFTK